MNFKNINLLKPKFKFILFVYLLQNLPITHKQVYEVLEFYETIFYYIYSVVISKQKHLFLTYLLEWNQPGP